MGLRQRNGFDGVNAAREDLNLTKYDEKYILPTEPSNADGYRTVSAPESLFPTAGGTQSPVQTPAPDPVEHNYVFGRRDAVDARANVFGNAEAQNGFAAPVGNAYNTAPSPTVQSERPMVFMLRDDANMFVYEYSDRLEYFRRTEVGMVHCATKFKAKKY